MVSFVMCGTMLEMNVNDQIISLNALFHLLSNSFVMSIATPTKLRKQLMLHLCLALLAFFINVLLQRYKNTLTVLREGGGRVQQQHQQEG